MINIILCGGSDTRFQLTLKRNNSVFKSQYIASNQEQYFLDYDFKRL